MRADVATGGSKADRRPGEPLGDLGEHEVEPIGLDQVGLGDHRDRGRHREMLEHGEVLDGLRHEPFVRRDDEQGEIDARRAGHHRPHEVLVAGHVDHARHDTAGQRERREVEVDRDSPPTLLGQPVHRRAR